MAVRKNKPSENVHFDALNAFLSTVQEEVVQVTYDLVTSADVTLREIYIGYTKINLKKDQDTEDKDHFRNDDKNPYECTLRIEGLRVVVIASGLAGGFWVLKVKMKKSEDIVFNDLEDNPIKEKTDEQGHLDHIKFHK
jgi:hypothetical protein